MKRAKWLITATLLMALVFPLGPASAQGDQAEPEKIEESKNYDFAGFPLANYTTDRGLGFGAFVSFFYFSDTPKEKEPYRASVALQYYQTTDDYAFHKLLLDFPNLFDTRMRLDVVSGYEAWQDANYFGIGNDVPRLRQEDTPRRYYNYDVVNFWLVPTLRIPVAKKWDIFVKANVRFAEVKHYENSLLTEIRPVGFSGGFYPQLSLGLLTDRRNKEPSTSQGYVFEASLRTAQRFLLSDFESYGANITFRQWFEIGDSDDYVFAYRLAADTNQGETPFFHQSKLGGSQWVELGGNLVLRGLPFGRYHGLTTLYSNVEMRARLVRFRLWKRNFEVLGVTYLDAARVLHRDAPDNRPFNIHFTAGVGPRLVYNDVFVVRLDVGVGLDEFLVAPGSSETNYAPVLGINFMAGHPF